MEKSMVLLLLEKARDARKALDRLIAKLEKILEAEMEESEDEDHDREGADA